MKAKTRKFNDTVTMASRCLLLSVRNPDTFFASILLPALMMVLFVLLFGKLIRIGETSYTNYIVPGVLLQCIGQCSASTAILMNRDMTSGIVTRFCTLPIHKMSILNGHVLEAAVRNLLTSFIVIVVAVFLGFKPSTRLCDWLIVLLLLSGVILAFSWLAVAVGIFVSSAEGASAVSSVAVILPYLSSGFVTPETLPNVLAFFAKYQPMTPIIDAMRAALLGGPFELHTFLTAILWCIGLIFVFYGFSRAVFRKKIRQ